MKTPILSLIAAATLWMGSNTILAQCSLVKDITLNGDSWPKSYTDVNGTLFFSTGPGNGEQSLYKSDGTDAGTTLIKQMPYTTIASFTSFNGKLLFFGASSGSGSADLLTSDGTAAGTVLVKTFVVSTQYAKGFEIIGNTAYFTSSNSAAGAQLWKTDGTTAGTTVLTDVGATTSNTVEIRELVSIGNTVYFVTNVGNQFQKKAELWKTDGTVAGTSQVSNFTGAGGNSIINQMTVVNGVLFFFHDDYFGTAGQELWKSDGTLAGTVVVKRAPPYNIYSMNGLLYFSTWPNATNWELWRSDGTTAGTISVGTVTPGNLSWEWFNTKVVGDKAYFLLGPQSSTKELWVTDGTAAGTQSLYRVAPSNRNINDIPLLAVGGSLYFSRIFGAVVQIMKTQGTVAGSTILCDYVFSNTNESFIYEIGRVNQTLYFAPFVNSAGNFIGKELHKHTDITIANKEKLALTSLKLYPNPAQNSLIVESLDKVNSIAVLNASGTVVSVPSKGSTLDLTNVVPGLYFARVQTAAGMATLKFVKE